MPGLSRARLLAFAAAASLLAFPASGLAQAAGSDAPIATGPRSSAPVHRAARGETPSPGPTLKSVDAADFVALLREAGLNPRWETVEEGRLLFGMVEGETPFQVVLQQCTALEEGCVDFQLYAGFRMQEPPSLEVLNRWNRDYTWGAFAYATPEGAPVLTAQYTLSGGVAREHLKEILFAWGGALQQFVVAIGLVEAAPPAAGAKP